MSAVENKKQLYITEFQRGELSQVAVIVKKTYGVTEFLHTWQTVPANIRGASDWHTR